MAMVGIFVSACVNDLKEVNRVTSYDELPVQTIVNSNITYTDSGRITFAVKAGMIERYSNRENPVDEFSKGVLVTTFNQEGEVESELSADRATNFIEENVMIAKDSVILKNSEGKTLNTEELTWDKNKGKIFTDKFVRITTPTEILYGDGLDAREDFTEYTIRNIKGRISIDASDEENDSTSSKAQTPDKTQ